MYFADSLLIFQFVFLWWAVVGLVSAHGYMSSPAARNSAWRVGFDVAADYNDNELSCGGRGVSRSEAVLEVSSEKNNI